MQGHAYFQHDPRLSDVADKICIRRRGPSSVGCMCVLMMDSNQPEPACSTESAVFKGGSPINPIEKLVDANVTRNVGIS